MSLCDQDLFSKLFPHYISAEFVILRPFPVLNLGTYGLFGSEYGNVKFVEELNFKLSYPLKSILLIVKEKTNPNNALQAMKPFNSCLCYG